MLTYLKTTVGLVLVLLAVIASFTRWRDPFQIFCAPGAHTGLEVNQRFWKTRRILESTPPYTGFILGDSRAAQLPATALNHDDVRFFNYATPSETIDESLQKVRFLLAQPVPPKEIVLFVRLGSPFAHQPCTVPNDLSRLDHPAISGVSRLDFYARFLLSRAALEGCFRAPTPPGVEPHKIAHAADGTIRYSWAMTPVRLAAALSNPTAAPDADTLANELTTHQLIAIELNRHSIRVLLVVPPTMQESMFSALPPDDLQAYLRTLEDLYHSTPIRSTGQAILQDAANWNDPTHASQTALRHYILPPIQNALKPARTD